MSEPERGTWPSGSRIASRKSCVINGRGNNGRVGARQLVLPSCNLPGTIRAVALLRAYRESSSRTGRASLAQHATVRTGVVGGAMKTLVIAAATILAAPGCALEAMADDAMVTKAGSAAPATVSSQPAACGSFEDFFLTSCGLTSSGITVYGIVDTGVSCRSHGAPFNGTPAPGVGYLIQKYSNRPRWDLGPNGLSQSNIGLKGKEPIAAGWDFIFDLQAGFDPYLLHFPNGPHSVAQNAGIPLTSQDSYADSSRAGQFYNSVGYVGVSSPYGTLTLFRQNALTLDAVFAYDPMGASYAFSPLGWQGLTCGAGTTETCRHSTALKYRVDIGQFRVAALWQFGGYELNNGATGTYQLQVGGDINLAGGKLSLDAIGSYAQNAV